MERAIRGLCAPRARHPKTLFIGVHFGNAPEDPDLVAQLLDTYPNLVIDTAARLPAIGRRDSNHSPERMRAFFLKYQDRVLFGTTRRLAHARCTDVRLGDANSDGSRRRSFLRGDLALYETTDTDISPARRPFRDAGHFGVGLPREVLEKIYYKNAVRLLGVSLPRPLPKPGAQVYPGNLQDL